MPREYLSGYVLRRISFQDTAPGFTQVLPADPERILLLITERTGGFSFTVRIGDDAGPIMTRLVGSGQVFDMKYDDYGLAMQGRVAVETSGGTGLLDITWITLRGVRA